MFSLIIETCLIILISALLYLFEPQASLLFAYYHIGLADFELWRLITGSFCHTNFNHLMMNLIGLIVTLLLFIDTFNKIKIWPLFIFSSLFISLCLFIFEPSLIWYVGLSGVLHGLFSYGIMSDLKNRDVWGYLLGGGFIIKITYEQFFGPSESTIALIEANVAINAHLFGATSGVVFYFLHLLYKRNYSVSS